MPAAATSHVTLSVHTVPALWDHTFFNQPAGWTNPADFHPVVPMTKKRLGRWLTANSNCEPSSAIVRAAPRRNTRVAFK